MSFTGVIGYYIAAITIVATVFFSLVYFLNEKKMHMKEEGSHTPPVSILVPAKNEEEYICACVESLLALNYPKELLEIIVMDDGSTDSTAQKVRGYEKFGVRLISKKNSGKADSLNQGIKVAKGEIIATMDADSYAAPDSLRMMVTYFKDKRVGAVAASVIAQNPKGVLGEIQRVEYLFAIFMRRIMEHINCVTVTPGPFSIFRKSAIIEIGGFDPKSLVEDQEIALNMQKHGYLIRTAPGIHIRSEIPANFFELMHQRVRWQRGGFYNAVKYRSLIGINRGDLGIIVMPYTLLGYITLTLIPITLFLDYLTESVYGQYFGFASIALGFGSLHVLSAVMLFFTLFWLYLGMREYFPKERITIFSMALFVCIYPFLLTFFWVVAAYKEITRQTRIW